MTKHLKSFIDDVDDLTDQMDIWEECVEALKRSWDQTGMVTILLSEYIKLEDNILDGLTRGMKYAISKSE